MDTSVLKAMVAAAAAGQVFYVSAAEGMPLVNHNPPLIEVDRNVIDPNDGSKIKATLTEAGARMVTAPQQNEAAPTSVTVFNGGFVRPPVKRGGGRHAGAAPKYPFDSLEVGAIFFLANSAVAKRDALKTLSSAVGSANQRYAVATGEMKQVERAKRDEKNKAIKGPDGKNVMETVTLPVKQAQRKFTAVPVKAGVKYGEWTAPADGAVAQRTL